MDDKEFVRRLRTRLVEEDIATYFGELDSSGDDEIMIKEWKDAARLYQNLGAQDRLALRNFVRMISANNLSTFLGVLDGTTSLGSVEAASLVVKVNGSDEKLNGYLQDIYIELDEDTHDLGTEE